MRVYSTVADIYKLHTRHSVVKIDDTQNDQNFDEFFFFKSAGYILQSAAGEKTLKTSGNVIKYRRYHHFILPSIKQRATI